MPSHFPTTSPVAVAAARILAAYLSNHKLSPAEAASLGGMIVEALAALTREAGITSATSLAPVEEPPPRRPTQMPADQDAPAAEEPPALIPEPEAEPEADAERGAEPIAAREDDPAPPLAPGGALPLDAPAELAAAGDLPRKRKRPSRPRSRRGKGPAAQPLLTVGAPHEASSDDEPNGVPPDIGFFSTAVEIAMTPAIAVAEAVAEDAEATPKPRRATSRARRVTTP